MLLIYDHLITLDGKESRKYSQYLGLKHVASHMRGQL